MCAQAQGCGRACAQTVWGVQVVLDCYAAGGAQPCRMAPGLNTAAQTLALDFFGVPKSSWPLGLQVLATTADEHAQKAEQAEQARRAAAWQHDVPGTAARLFTQVQAGFAAATFKQRYTGSVNKPFQAARVRMVFVPLLDKAQPPTLHLVPEHAQYTVSYTGWKKVRAEDLQAGPAGQESVFGALAGLCSAQGLSARCFVGDVEVWVAS